MEYLVCCKEALKGSVGECISQWLKERDKTVSQPVLFVLRWSLTLSPGWSAVT